MNEKERMSLNIVLIVAWLIFTGFIVYITNNTKFLWLLCGIIVTYIFKNNDEEKIWIT